MMMTATAIHWTIAGLGVVLLVLMVIGQMFKHNEANGVDDATDQDELASLRKSVADLTDEKREGIKIMFDVRVHFISHPTKENYALLNRIDDHLLGRNTNGKKTDNRRSTHHGSND